MTSPRWLAWMPGIVIVLPCEGCVWIGAGGRPCTRSRSAYGDAPFGSASSSAGRSVEGVLVLTMGGGSSVRSPEYDRPREDVEETDPRLADMMDESPCDDVPDQTRASRAGTGIGIGSDAPPSACAAPPAACALLSRSLRSATAARTSA